MSNSLDQGCSVMFNPGTVEAMRMYYDKNNPPRVWDKWSFTHPVVDVTTSSFDDRFATDVYGLSYNYSADVPLLVCNDSSKNKTYASIFRTDPSYAIADGVFIANPVNMSNGAFVHGMFVDEASRTFIPVTPGKQFTDLAPLVNKPLVINVKGRDFQQDEWTNCLEVNIDGYKYRIPNGVNRVAEPLAFRVHPLAENESGIYYRERIKVPAENKCFNKHVSITHAYKGTGDGYYFIGTKNDTHMGVMILDRDFKLKQFISFENRSPYKGNGRIKSHTNVAVELNMRGQGYLIACAVCYEGLEDKAVVFQCNWEPHTGIVDNRFEAIIPAPLVEEIQFFFDTALNPFRNPGIPVRYLPKLMVFNHTGNRWFVNFNTLAQKKYYNSDADLVPKPALGVGVDDTTAPIFNAPSDTGGGVDSSSESQDNGDTGNGTDNGDGEGTGTKKWDPIWFEPGFKILEDSEGRLIIPKEEIDDRLEKRPYSELVTGPDQEEDEDRRRYLTRNIEIVEETIGVRVGELGPGYVHVRIRLEKGSGTFSKMEFGGPSEDPNWRLYSEEHLFYPMRWHRFGGYVYEVLIVEEVTQRVIARTSSNNTVYGSMFKPAFDLLDFNTKQEFEDFIKEDFKKLMRNTGYKKIPEDIRIFEFFPYEFRHY